MNHLTHQLGPIHATPIVCENDNHGLMTLEKVEKVLPVKDSAQRSTVLLEDVLQRQCWQAKVLFQTEKAVSLWASKAFGHCDGAIPVQDDPKSCFGCLDVKATKEFGPVVGIHTADGILQ